MPELEPLPLVHSKVLEGNPLCSREKLPGSQGAMLWLLKATATIALAAAEGIAWLLCWLKSTQRSSNAAVAGGSQLKRKDGAGSSAGNGWRKRRRLSLAEGRRGTQERNCISSSFKSFIQCSFQGGS